MTTYGKHSRCIPHIPNFCVHPDMNSTDHGPKECLDTMGCVQVTLFM